ncbi:toll/interleukin-1 receptor domain-containing protein [uncultured Desulfosarcina sp.]|uniref:toll/interleukin-1 receptor domain-containing protein n=1 Tax=uncultured Desulfosarcina sp. TaxID=218289 RepID=UPI0029C8B137|nr:toll/interleukin-1 receptor domain-containing protein [uncultured Desulfosarcina sp.]
MALFYELAVLGAPTDDQVGDLEQFISDALEPFGMKLGHEVSWLVKPLRFCPKQKKAAAAVFFGGKGVKITDLDHLIKQSIPVLPVVSDSAMVRDEIPESLRFLNCLVYNDGGTQRVATALLECVGLLPRQRRVFLSYRRDEARHAALQLFDELSSRIFDVFLDTHGIAPAEDFQAMLWHRLCDSDVLVMLDTPNYFESRWTSAEFGRALAKGISVLRIGWPSASPSARTATASRVDLLDEEVDQDTGQLAKGAIKRICSQLEAVRSQSYAIRNLNLVSNLRNAIEMIGGNVTGVGMHKAVYIQLADGKNVVVYPTVGVPTSTTLHDATNNSPNCSSAVIFDPVGLHPGWIEHLDWLGSQIRSTHWVKATEVAWQFADWGD